MPKPFTVAAALVAAWTSAGAVSAAAETTLDAGVQVTPGQAGTAKRPQGVKVAFKVHLSTPPDVNRPIVTGFEVWHGPGLAFDRGTGYAECARSVLARMGPDGCPSRSRLGGGGGPLIEDPIEASPRFAIFNGPGRQPLAYITLQRPARVRAVASIAMVHKTRSAWPHRMLWTFPETLHVVAGIPITPSSLAFTYGYTKAAKLYVSSTSCPKGGWRWRVRVHIWHAPGNAPVLQQDGRAPCSRR